MSGSKNRPENRVKVGEQMTRRVCECDRKCGGLISTKNMLTVVSTSFAANGRLSTRNKYFIREHYGS